ncbi:MAG: dissimilatory-type sulfite reductase subunit beta [Magnetococcales bacterium]|nr:dissimilatory-type sulfite reductase subunit beta [Magnetococcales bacterium]MBF0307983.1 dissimilatory-type sulfite reductase subunit beta [Magnetococcales bacterium]
MSEQKMGPRNQGAPDYTQHLHPLMTKNYGKWSYHERLRPGVLVHVAENGDKLFTVRAGSPRTMSAATVHKICDIADKYCDGFLRFTTRTNVEFLLGKESDIPALIADVEKTLGFPIGGTGPSISNIAHTQGWLHCNLPGTDAAGAVKAMMDELIDEFTHERLPNRVRLSTSCCQINCASHADISVIVQHHHPPRINHNNMQICELPKVVAICPAAAIRPAVVNGKESVEVVDEKCMYCGACHGQCPSMEIRDAETDSLSIWIGGKTANTRGGPTFMKLAVWGLPNRPPRWPEVGTAVRTIIEAYKSSAKPWERVGEWVERIGWQRFFEMTGFPFTKYHIDDSPEAFTTFNRSTHVRL